MTQVRPLSNVSSMSSRRSPSGRGFRCGCSSRAISFSNLMEPGDDEAETRGARRRQARKGNGGVAGGAPPQSCGLCRGPRPRNRATAERRFATDRSEEHPYELQSLLRISYAVFCLQKKKTSTTY